MNNDATEIDERIFKKAFNLCKNDNHSRFIALVGYDSLPPVLPSNSVENLLNSGSKFIQYTSGSPRLAWSMLLMSRTIEYMFLYNLLRVYLGLLIEVLPSRER
tara:strand:+ start:153 stop:461 length:309 start_codon:yes stop_codon:yes gene_type:complete